MDVHDQNAVREAAAMGARYTELVHSIFVAALQMSRETYERPVREADPRLGALTRLHRDVAELAVELRRIGTQIRDAANAEQLRDMIRALHVFNHVSLSEAQRALEADLLAAEPSWRSHKTPPARLQIVERGPLSTTDLGEQYADSTYWSLLEVFDLQELTRLIDSNDTDAAAQPNDDESRGVALAEANAIWEAITRNQHRLNEIAARCDDLDPRTLKRMFCDLHETTVKRVRLRVEHMEDRLQPIYPQNGWDID